MRLRLLVVMVGVVAFVLAIHDIPLAGHLERVESDRFATKLERDAFILAGRVEEALEDGTATEEPALRALVVRYGAEEDVRVVVVDSAARAVVASDESTLGEDFSNRPEITQALIEGEPQTGERYSATLGGDLFYVAVPVLSGTERVGVVRLSAPEQLISERVSRRVRGLLFVALISLLIAVVLAIVLAGTVTRPLRRLRAATDGFATGDLSARADPTGGPPELRALATSFNAMAARLQRLVDQQRAFAGTASHQLRTPLTALRLRLEQLATAADDGSPDSLLVDDALAETDRLHRMIEGLLALSRADDGAHGPVEIDLDAIARERIAYWEPLASERGVELSGRLVPGARVVAIRGAAEQVIDNLIDNGLDVSPEGGRLRVVVEPVTGGADLHVIDEGPGLPDDERDRAFDRFWRGPDSPEGGTGLGLAIVRQLMEAGGGSAELRRSEAGGIDAVARFRSPATRA